MILIRHGQTEFNRVFSLSRRDPGIRDPHLTAEGRRQARWLIAMLRPLNLRRLVVSPYIRALETATIISAGLDLPVTVEALVAERCGYACDVGSPLPELSRRWPDLAFDHLPDPWWPQPEESEAALRERSERFRAQIAEARWSELAVVTHWGFIRALTGLRVPNGAALRIDPTRPERQPEPIFLPDTA